MGLLTHQGDALIHADAYALEQRLWDTDPRLQLKYVTVEHPTRRGVKGHRYEVWRHNEDGTDGMIGHWRLEEFDQIETDLAVMRAGADGRAASAVERLDAHDKVMEKQKADEFADAYGPMAEHKLALVRDQGHRTRFGYDAGN